MNLIAKKKSRLIFNFLAGSSILVIFGLTFIQTVRGQIPSQEGSNKSDACRAGTGWMWSDGPSQPAAAQAAQIALNNAGISASVEATGFGEKDSCGTYVQSSTDFFVTLAGNTGSNLEAEPDLSNRIFPILDQFALPRLGNVRITFGPGVNRNYVGPLDATSSPSQDIIPASTHSLAKKVYLLIYDPILQNHQSFHTYMGWESPTSLATTIINSFFTASHGELTYTVVSNHTVTDHWPVKLDGFQYTEAQYLLAYQNRTPHEPGSVNYDAIVQDPSFDICGKLNRGEIDELWIYGGPYDGFYESRLIGPNGYWFNSPPMENSHGCGKLLPIMGLNFERGLPEAMESFGHRTESTLSQAFGGWEENSTDTNWDKFALVKAQSPNYSYSGCGSIHYPANGVHDYDWSNPATALSTCEDFNNYPNLGDPISVAQPVTCTTWGCTNIGYLMYWYSHLPHNSGCAVDARSNDWWQYFADTNLVLTPNILCPAAPCPVITMWKGEYWLNSTLNGPRALCRNDQTLDFDWGVDEPGFPIPEDHFSTRWTRTVNFTAGDYRFHMRHDDGARLYIDNVLILDAWSTCCVTDTILASLDTGSHVIRMDYSEISGAANAALWWEPATINGWKGEYFNNESLSGNPAIIRDEPVLDFEWQADSPDPMVVPDHFSARWSKTIYFSKSWYRFNLFRDDGIRLKLDGTTILDDWEYGREWDSTSRYLTEGYHAIIVEAYDIDGWASASFIYYPEQFFIFLPKIAH